MTEYVLHIGGTIEQAGKVLSRDGDVLTVELDDGRVITRHEKNFVLGNDQCGEWSVTPTEMQQLAPIVPMPLRKRGRPKKS